MTTSSKKPLPPARPRICLNMIVKDESAILERCLESLAPSIDTFVICDTGSKDDTPKLIKKILTGKHKIAGLVDTQSVPFRNFEQARNGAIEAALRYRNWDYLLFADADMELVTCLLKTSGSALGPKHDLRDHLLPHKALQLYQHSGPHLSYTNTRLVSRELLQRGARYIGLTHEYLDTCGVEPVTIAEDVAHFLDHADGSSRPEKMRRDIDLLHETLRRNPADARAMFYLAQTYKDSGDYEDAIRFYKRRITAGGWEEEIWYSHFMIAHCLRQLGREEDALRQALTAYQLRPTRAEPLHFLAKMFRDRGENALAILMCETGSRIPIPKDQLFVDRFVYEHGFRQEVSISGYYARPYDRETYDEAYAACMDLALRRDVPEEVRNAAWDNAAFYALPASKAFGESFQTTELRFDAPLVEGYRPTNPSVYGQGFAPTPHPLASGQAARTPPAAGGGPTSSSSPALLCVVRWVNYELGKEAPGGIVRTENEFVELDPTTLEIQRRIPFHDEAADGIHEKCWIFGYEDCRLFRWRDRWWASATVRDRNSEGRAEIALLELFVVPEAVHVRRCHVLRYRSDVHQKNWAPLVSEDGGTLRFVYEADPTTIVEVDPETFDVREMVMTRSLFSAVTFRGSSQAVPFTLVSRIDRANLGQWAVTTRMGFLYVVHEAYDRPNAGRRYLHRLVWLEGENHSIQHVSDPFYFEHEGVEFCAGLAYHAPTHEFFLSYGVEDKRACIARVSASAIEEWLLRPVRREVES